MTRKQFAHILTLALAAQITWLTINANVIQNTAATVAEASEIADLKDSYPEEAPALPQIEEEEEVITHHKNWSLASLAKSGLLYTYEYVVHFDIEYEHHRNINSPPPRS